MQLTKNLIRFNKEYVIKIPVECKRLWDLSDNRWGYKKYNGCP
jgi:hypothetical protein